MKGKIESTGKKKEGKRKRNCLKFSENEQVGRKLKKQESRTEIHKKEKEEWEERRTK